VNPQRTLPDSKARNGWIADRQRDHSDARERYYSGLARGCVAALSRVLTDTMIL
jgi:hypothetical protein